jgi:hypothetical protein
MFMCRSHWFALRPALQAAIWREYRSGQEIDKKASPRYLAVQQLAIAELAFRPNDEHAALEAGRYIVRARAFRQAAIEAKQGDPLQGLVVD